MVPAVRIFVQSQKWLALSCLRVLWSWLSADSMQELFITVNIVLSMSMPQIYDKKQLAIFARQTPYKRLNNVERGCPMSCSLIFSCLIEKSFCCMWATLNSPVSQKIDYFLKLSFRIYFGAGSCIRIECQWAWVLMSKSICLDTSQDSRRWPMYEYIERGYHLCKLQLADHQCAV